jgi:hypothetical protein
MVIKVLIKLNKCIVIRNHLSAKKSSIRTSISQLLAGAGFSAIFPTVRRCETYSYLGPGREYSKQVLRSAEESRED